MLRAARREAALLRQQLTASAVPGTQLLAERHESHSQLYHLALKNTGDHLGPGGRSSISGVHATVFGCTGFLGRYVVHALARQGSQVVCPYRCDEIDMQHLKVMGDLGQVVRYRDMSIRNDAQLREVLKRSNVIINLLGLAKETPNFSFEDVHIDAARRIATLAAESGVAERLIHVSCLGASEQSSSRRLRTKAAGEKAVLDAFPDATIFKPGPLVGQEDKLYNTYAKMGKALPIFPLIGGGTARRQPSYVRDVANALVNTLNSKEPLGATYHLGGPEVLSIAQMVELTYDLIREPYRSVTIPTAVAKLIAAPREAVMRKLPFNIMWSTMFTRDAIDELADDLLMPEGPCLTFQDLGINPQKVSGGLPLEHVRHYRAGGYDLGTTSEKASTGGAGYK